MLAEWRDRGEVSGSRQRTIDQFHTRGAGRHPQGRNAVEQPRGARLDAPVGGAAPLWKVNYRFWYLTFHSRSSRGDPPHEARCARVRKSSSHVLDELWRRWPKSRRRDARVFAAKSCRIVEMSGKAL